MPSPYSPPTAIEEPNLNDRKIIRLRRAQYAFTLIQLFMVGITVQYYKDELIDKASELILPLGAFAAFIIGIFKFPKTASIILGTAVAINLMYMLANIPYALKYTSKEDFYKHVAFGITPATLMFISLVMIVIFAFQIKQPKDPKKPN